MKLEDFKLGWLVGNFSPSIFRTSEVEFGIKYYKKNTSEPNHVHKLCDEYTIIISGKAVVNDNTYNKGDIIHIKKNQPAQFTTLEDTITAVIKTPSIVNDKHIL